MTDRGGDREQRSAQREREVRREMDRREIRRELERRDGEQAEDRADGHAREESSGTRDERSAGSPETKRSEEAGSSQSEGEGLRLVTRGVLANSPWRLFLSFRTVIAAAFATGAYALTFPTIWQLGDALGWPRLVTLMVVSIAAMIFWMIVGHSLWERPHHEAELNPRVTPAMQNVVTLLTLTLAVLVSYAVLFGLLLLAAWLFIPNGVIESSLGHSVDFGNYLILAWVAASVSTITGALGSGLEDDAEVREAVNYR